MRYAQPSRFYLNVAPLLLARQQGKTTFTFKALKKVEDQKLEFLLYKEGVKDVYRSLHLWMDVKE